MQSKKMKLYFKFNSGEQDKSVYSQMDKFEQIEHKLKLKGNSNITFIVLINFILDSFNTDKDVSELKKGDILIDRHNNKNKYEIHTIDFLNKEIILVHNISDNHKTWYGFNFLKTIIIYLVMNILKDICTIRKKWDYLTNFKTLLINVI